MNSAADWKGKLKKAWEKRADYVEKNGLQAFRLAGRSDLRMPISIDLYQDNADLKNIAAVIQVWEEMGGIHSETGSGSGIVVKSGWEADMENILREKFKVSGFFYKQRYRDAKGVLRNSADFSAKFAVEEYGNKFLVNLSDYLDTGLFLDHREARRLVAKRSAGRVVANLFAYTGAFSVYAARGGASFTHTVDLSRVYLDWTRENFKLNGMPDGKNWTYKMDTFEFFKYATRKGLRFDLMVIDPPTFSKNKSSNFNVQRDHYKLLTEAGKLLNQGGEIFFSTNFLDFRLSPDLMKIFKIENISRQTIPIDFFVEGKGDRSPNGGKQIHEAFWLKPLK